MTVYFVAVAIVTAVYCPNLRVNFILGGIVALAFYPATVTDAGLLLVAAALYDLPGGYPLMMSLLPFALVYVVLRLLQLQLYLQSPVSRLVWSILSALLFNTVWILILFVRSPQSIYWRHWLAWGLCFALVDGAVISLLIPLLQHYLGFRFSDLRSKPTIVVP